MAATKPPRKKSTNYASRRKPRPPGNREGRHIPNDETRAIVRAMSMSGYGQQDVSVVLQIDEKTLRKHYRKELDLAALQANTLVGNTAFMMATGGGPPRLDAEGRNIGGDWRQAVPSMTIFWMKTRMGFRETTRHEHSGPNGAPMQTQQMPPDLSKLTDEQLGQLETIVGALAGGSGASGGDQG